jgi:di/tricarboxylate transporter
MKHLQVILFLIISLELLEVVFKSIKQYKRNSKCSRESLSTWGERNTQKRLIL